MNEVRPLKSYRLASWQGLWQSVSSMLAMTMTTDKQMELILGRRSIRIYCPGDVSDGVVTRLLEAAMAAPSAMTKDPWRFVIVRDKQMLSQMGSALPGGKMLATATLSLVVCGDLEAAFEQDIGYLLQDCSAAIQNLLLAAHIHGLGACWVGVYPAKDSVVKLKELLALPKRLVPVAAISLGLPGEQLEPRTRYNQDYIRAEKWT
jgi:nitroreductase